MDALLVVAHPDPASYTHALAAAARRGLERAGHEVAVLDLDALGFVPAMSRDERTAYHEAEPLLDPMTVEHARLVQQASTLVFAYPTWWSGPPAILKGWLERVLVPGVAFRFDERGKVRPALDHVGRIVGISTYGSPRALVALQTDGGRRILTRALRMSCGWRTRTRWLGLYSVDTAGYDERERFVERVEAVLAGERRR